jgi:hypothetical protein
MQMPRDTNTEKLIEQLNLAGAAIRPPKTGLFHRAAKRSEPRDFAAARNNACEQVIKSFIEFNKAIVGTPEWVKNENGIRGSAQAQLLRDIPQNISSAINDQMWQDRQT